MSTLRERDIRPESIMRDKQAAIDADRAFLLDRRDRFVAAVCPACGANESARFGEKDGFAYDRCGACGTVYTNPRPSEDLLAEFYAASENYRVWNEVVFPATEAARRERIFRPRAERLLALLRDRGLEPRSALDVGAAFGTFAAELDAQGDFERLVALEPTPGLAATCRERGFETIESPLEAIEPAPEFDLVTAFEVIEHVFDPRGFIERCAALLRPGGALALSCPSAHGLEPLLAGVGASCFDHEHLNYFHPRSLAALVRRCGLEPIETLTPGRLDVDLCRRAIAEGRIDADHPLVRALLVDRVEELAGPLQEFLAEHRLSSHLWLVARLPASEGDSS